MISAGITLLDIAKGAGAGMLLPFVGPLTGAAAAFAYDYVTDDDEVQAEAASAPNEIPDKPEQDDSYSEEPLPEHSMRCNSSRIGRNVGFFDDDASTFLSVFAPGMKDSEPLDVELLEKKGRESDVFALAVQAQEMSEEVFVGISRDIDRVVLEELDKQVDETLPPELGRAIMKTTYTFVPDEMMDFAKEYQEVMTDPQADPQKKKDYFGRLTRTLIQYSMHIQEYSSALKTHAGAVEAYEAAQLDKLDEEGRPDYLENRSEYEERRRQYRELPENNGKEMPGQLQGNLDVHQGFYDSLLQLAQNPNLNLLEHGLEVHPEFREEDEDPSAESPDPASENPVASQPVANYRPPVRRRASAVDRLTKNSGW